MLAFVVDAPGAEGEDAGGKDVDDAVKAKDVGKGTNKEDDGDREEVIEHKLEGQDAAFDPLRGVFLDGGLGRDVDKVEGSSGDEHEDGDKH